MSTAYVQPVDVTGKPVQAQVVAVQQPVMMIQQQQQPAQAQVVAVGGGAGSAMDMVAFQNLANVQDLEFKQGGVFWEAVSGGW
jgi:hypothetical protein